MEDCGGGSWPRGSSTGRLAESRDDQLWSYVSEREITDVLAIALRSVIVLLALFPLPSAGQAPAGRVTQIDAVSVSPERFKILLENTQVRVIEYVLRPGERDQWHTHPPKVSYIVTGGTLRITTENGQSFLADEKAGSATWMGALGRHFAQNVGKTPVRIVLVEIKGAS